MVVDGEAETEGMSGTTMAEIGGEREWEREELMGEFKTGERWVG